MSQPSYANAVTNPREPGNQPGDVTKDTPRQKAVLSRPTSNDKAPRGKTRRNRKRTNDKASADKTHEKNKPEDDTLEKIMPEEKVPKEDMPKEDMPENNIPEKTPEDDKFNNNKMPENHTPDDNTPDNGTVADNTPNDDTPDAGMTENHILNDDKNSTSEDDTPGFEVTETSSPGQPSFRIDIKSADLHRFLCDVIGPCEALRVGPGPNGPCSIDLFVLYPHLKDLRNHLKQKQDTSKQVQQLIDYLETHRMRHTGNVNHRMVFYSELLAMWDQSQAPRYAYTTFQGFHDGPPLIFKVDYFYWVTEVNYQAFRVSGRFLDSCGKGFGYTPIDVDIPFFHGRYPVTALNVYPLQYHPNYGDKLRRDFTLRGEMFVKLSGGLECHRAYQGITWFQMGDGLVSNDNVNSRIMIDPITFRKLKNYTAKDFVQKVEVSGLLPEDYMITFPFVPGWCFSRRLWRLFDVSRISDVVWKSQLLDTLGLAPKEKKIVRNVAMTIRYFLHNRIVVIEGLPGRCKTPVAEAVSEHHQRPLIAIHAGDLGTDPLNIPQGVSHYVRMCKAWGANILFDETELSPTASRAEYDANRNALIGTFLRELVGFRRTVFWITESTKGLDIEIQRKIDLTVKLDAPEVGARETIVRVED